MTVGCLLLSPVQDPFASNLGVPNFVTNLNDELHESVQYVNSQSGYEYVDNGVGEGDFGTGPVALAYHQQEREDSE